MNEETKQALDDLLSKYKSAIQDVEGLKSNMATVATKSDVEAVKEAVDKANQLSDKVDKLIEDVTKVAAETDKATKQHENRPVSFKESLMKALNEKSAELKALKEAKHQISGFGIEVKSAGTMTLSNYTGGTALTDMVEPGITGIPTRRPFLLQILNPQPTTSNTIRYVQKKNRDGGAGVTAEGTAKTQADFDLVETTATVQKITSYIKVSKEMMDDIPFIMGEINGELRTLVNLKIDSELLAGSTFTSDISDSASTFTAGTWANSVPSANNMDVLRIAISQIAVNLFDANYILMHPTDVAQFDLEKDADGQYVIPPFRSINGMQVKGVQIIENTGVTAGTYYVGDFTKMTVKMREEFNIAVGFENDDFTKNLVTILGEARLACYFKSNYAGAIIEGTFADDKAAITL